MGAYKPKNAYQYNNTKYAKKTSEHGHYEPEITGKRYGRDGSMANFTTMNWVEDNREVTQAAPVAEPEPPKEEPKAPVTPSNTLQDAMNTVQARKPKDQSYTSTNRNAERRALTDSFSQPKSYDPEAGIASKAAGNFLDDYKLNLKQKLNPNPNGGE